MNKVPGKIVSLVLSAVVCSLLAIPAFSQAINSNSQGSRAGMSAGTAVAPQSPVMSTPTEPAPNPSASTALTSNAAGAAPPVVGSPSDLRIGVGDLLEVAVFGAPDFDKQVRVSSSGEVTLPLVGAVRLAGATTAEAEKLLEKKLLDGGFFNDPHVSVFEKEYQTQGVSVLGEVQKPGIYPMLGSHKLFDVISAAGGTTPKAGNQVTIAHRDRSQPSQNLTLAGNGSDSTRNNPDILPGDTVVIQKAGVVYVVGDVHMPGGFVMDKPELTVLQALAMAQGANPTAKLDAARLIRRNGNERQEVPIALKKILSSKAPDINLQADDILFVPNSAAKSVMRRGLEAIVQAATGVAIYHP
ncbi:MAG TPA: polysaccharide biosynthesis/export family protein [Candidatus Angelobacter sp.]|nr:polysaccharide biosynthesis/export family protein [Candidatus Angelobacter sp.]